MNYLITEENGLRMIHGRFVYTESLPQAEIIGWLERIRWRGRGQNE